MGWQNGAWPAEDPAQTWDTRGRDLAWIEEAIAARWMRAPAEEVS